MLAGSERERCGGMRAEALNEEIIAGIEQLIWWLRICWFMEVMKEYIRGLV